MRNHERSAQARQGRDFTGYAGMAQSGLDAVFDNMMDGTATITSKAGWKWDDIIFDLGMRMSDIAQVRQQQRTFLRANHKYPDFIEVGTDVWESVYYWHVKHLQRIESSRLADGRYAITFLYTNVLMRPDLAPNYVGVAFDGPPAR